MFLLYEKNVRNVFFKLLKKNINNVNIFLLQYKKKYYKNYRFFHLKISIFVLFRDLVICFVGFLVQTKKLQKKKKLHKKYHIHKIA